MAKYERDSRLYYLNGNLDKTGAFVSLLSGGMPEDEDCLKELFESFDQQIKEAHPEVANNRITGALNNAHGDWYEWLLACAAWNTHINNNTPYLAILLPNVSTLDISNLYQTDVQEIISDLKRKIAEQTEVRLITSNPDFVIVNIENMQIDLGNSSPFSFLNAERITFLTTLYTHLLDRCTFTDLLGYASVKTSFRPDRRLQIPHEGSLMKAMYTHIRTRKWIINAPGLKYYAFARKVGRADKEALKTVATHSITTVQSMPQAAVDEVYQVDKMGVAKQVFSEILCPTN